MISSPLGKQGLFYKSFQIGFTGGRAARNMLCIQAPTWEVNPTVPAATFESSYLKDPRIFFTEFGAEFTDRTAGWIEDAQDLFDCIDKDLKPKQRSAPRTPHFLGFDIAFVGDGAAVAIGHIDEKNQIVLDFIDQMKAGEGDYADVERLEFTDIAAWVYELSRRFYIIEGLFDSYAGIPLEQALTAKGLNQLKSVRFTKPLSSEVFQNFKNMMHDRRLTLFDAPIPAGEEHCDYIRELLTLQAEYQSKYITVVEAPNIQGMHDDLSEALVRMVWVASKHTAKVLAVGSYGARPGVQGKRPSLGQQLSDRRKALLGGSHPDRQVVPMTRRLGGVQNALSQGAMRRVSPRMRRG